MLHHNNAHSLHQRQANAELLEPVQQANLPPLQGFTCILVTVNIPGFSCPCEYKHEHFRLSLIIGFVCLVCLWITLIWFGCEMNSNLIVLMPRSAAVIKEVKRS